jgi:hypothetical protein
MIWVIFMTKTFYNGTNNIAKYNIFLGEESLNSSWRPQ